MAGEIRLITIEQGHDPRDFAFVAFGGAGPLHGAALMREMQLGTMLVPPSPGVLCAMGCVMADVRHDISRTIEQTLPRDGAPSAGRLDIHRLHEILREQRTEGERQLSLDGLEFVDVEVAHFADMSYEGQIHRLRVPLTADPDADRLRAAFVAQYQTEYGTELGELDVVLVNARTVVSGQRAAATSPASAPSGAAPTPRQSRPVCFGEWVETPIYDREELRPGCELAGPLIVEQPDTTVVVEPGMLVAVDTASNLIVRLR
jgi:N-methylhydantoinase A